MPDRPYSDEEWEEVKNKTSVHERLVWKIFDDYPPLEELRARTPEEVERIQKESDEKRRLPLKEAIRSVMGVLSVEERKVIELRFGIKDGRVRSVEETVSELTYSSDDVEHIEAVALQKLRLWGNILNATQSDYKVQDLDEFLQELEPKEGECLHPEVEEVIEESYMYAGSGLDPFEVKNARVLRCKSCNAGLIRSRDAHEWSIAKAKELIDRGGPYYGNEVHFLWSTTGLNLSAFAGEMSLSSDIAMNREQLVSWQNFRVPEEFEKIFVRTVKHWLEKEEVWQTHLKQRYPDKAGN